LSAGWRSKAQGKGLSNPKKVGVRKYFVWRRIFSSGKRGKYFRSDVDFQTDGTGEGFLKTRGRKAPMGLGGNIKFSVKYCNNILPALMAHLTFL